MTSRSGTLGDGFFNPVVC